MLRLVLDKKPHSDLPMEANWDALFFFLFLHGH